MTSNIFPAGFFLILSVLAGCRQEPEQRPEKVVHLRVRPVQAVEKVTAVRTAGRLASRKEFRLSFKTGGIIGRMAVNEGEKVIKGQLLATLELSEIESKYRQAELAVEKAERDYKRAENLYRDSVVTLELFQNANTALKVAGHELEIAQFNLEHSKIHAPGNGLILKKLAEEHEIVGPGQPVLYFASTGSEWILRVSVTDKDRILLNPGDSARISFDAFPDRQLSAKILEIAEIADTYTGTYDVELSFNDEIPSAINGLLGSAVIFPSHRMAYPMIPYEAMMEANGDKGILWKLKNGKPLRVEVTVYALDDEGIFIEKGIQPGDTVVVEGGQYIPEAAGLVIQNEPDTQ